MVACHSHSSSVVLGISPSQIALFRVASIVWWRRFSRRDDLSFRPPSLVEKYLDTVELKRNAA
jgi:hypothetical protein